MNILFKSFHSIDIDNDTVFSRDLPESFDSLIENFVEENEKVKLYTLNNESTVITDCIRKMYQEEDFDYRTDLSLEIAKHLLACEKIAQAKIYPMNAKVKKGSLLQAFLQKAEDEYQYVLAKVEHSAWIDGSSLEENYGFSSDKKSIWKFASFDFYVINGHVFFNDVKVFMDNKSKFWTVSFLEVEPKRDDASNTLNAFRAVDNELKSALKESSPRDYVMLSNEVMNTMNTPQNLDFNAYVECLMDDYQPVHPDLDKGIIKDCLLALPERKKFDVEFKTIPQSIENQRTKKYEIANGIVLMIKSNASDFSKRITSTVKDGKRVLEIVCDDLGTYDAFIEENDE